MAEFKEKTEYMAGMNWVLDESQKGSEQAYDISVLGKEFRVLPGVFSPKYYAETAFFTPLVTKYLGEGMDYLDVGCGVGVTTVFAAEKGASVTSLDINPQAVENTRQNVERYSLTDRVDVLQSDVYSALEEDAQFDVIYWNTPFGYVDQDTQLTTLQRAVFDPGYKSTQAFINGATKHLKQNGTLLIGFSSTLGDLEGLQTILKQAGFSSQLIAETIDPDSPPDKNIMLELYKAQL